MPAAPQGTVTFLLTDVEGSTRLWAAHPEQMKSALARHDQILRTAIEAHGGHVFSTAGDAFAAAFARVADALQAAAEVQRALSTESWPPATPIRVRIGVHTGEAQERDGDYFGSVVNRAARMMSTGHGGQVIVSSATAQLVSDALGDAFGLIDLGSHRLKDVRAPEHLWQLTAPGLDSEFAALRSQRRVQLPPERSGFVGRAAEIAAVTALLTEGADITLTGPGGVGKTRLALEVGWRVSGNFPDGVWFCDLAAVNDGPAVPRVVAAALEIPAQEKASPTESIVEAMSADRALIVLDNCEHVLADAAELVRELVDGCPRLSVLATSRERLGLRSEVVWAVAPLDPEGEAVELFALRARGADSKFDLGTHREATIELCRRLDGMPLAIELAAARTRALAPAELLARMEDPFRLLRSSQRDAPVRQRTLLETVEWSYQLLDETAQRFFDRLSVFAGSFDVDGAVAVAAERHADEVDVIDLLTELVDKSLVNADITGKQARYRLLETLRQFGARRLQAQAVLEETRRRHAEHFARVARRAQRYYESAECLEGLQLFETEWDNIRAAAAWALGTADVRLVRDLVEAPAWFAMWRQFSEVGDWAARAAVAFDDQPIFHGIAAVFAAHASEYESALDLARSGLDAAAFGSHPDTLFCHWALALLYTHMGEVDLAFSALEMQEAAANERGSDFNVTYVKGCRLVPASAVHANNLAAMVDEARRAAAHLRCVALDAMFGIYISTAEEVLGHPERAAQSWDESLEHAIRSHHRDAESGILAWRSVRAPVAMRDMRYLDALRRLQVARNWMYTWICLESLAAHWARERPALAALILGYMDEHRMGHGGLRPRRQRAAALVREHIGAREWLRAGATYLKSDLLARVIEELETITAGSSVS